MPNKWMYISTPKYTVAVSYRMMDKVVVKAPPIARWMLGKSMGYVTVYLVRVYGDKAIFIWMGE